MSYICYLIQSESNPNHTYIGTTNDLEKRLRQHNGIIKGGAKCTRRFNDWVYVINVILDNKSIANSFEWYWKHYQTKNGNWRNTKSGIHNKNNRLVEIKDKFNINDNSIKYLLGFD